MHRVVNHVERILYMVESMWYIEPCCTENILNGWTNVIHRTLLYNNVIWLNFQDSGKWINMVYAADGHVLIVLTFVMFVKNYNNLSTLGCGTNFERCNEFSKYASVNVYYWFSKDAMNFERCIVWWLCICIVRLLCICYCWPTLVSTSYCCCIVVSPNCWISSYWC